MSDVTPASRDRWRRVDEIVGLALETPPPDRASVVAKACAGDHELRREVESLLLADQQAEGFLEPPSVPRDPASAFVPLLAAGDVLAGRYRIEEHVGSGGMGDVYRARDLVLDSEVAVKALDPDLLAGRGRLEALRREVRLARLVTHANVCRVHDVVEDGERAFITMEYVAGESLAERLERTEALPLEEVLRVLGDVARGLAAAHAAGVIHRDLKAANVLLRQATGDAVVADFGVAAELGPGSDEVVRAGTRGYMAPEQWAGAPPDARSDVFSLGALAHRMATGRLPDEQPSPPLPPELARFVSACLRDEPGERPRDASAALRWLERAGASPKRTGARRYAAVAALVTLLAVLASAPWWRGRRAAWPESAGPLLAAVDTSQLEPADAWIGEAFRRLVVDDLIDAWDLEARTAPEVPRPDAIRSRLWRDAGGGLRAHLILPRGRSVADVRGGSLRELAQAASRGVVEGLVPEEARRPSARDLSEVGARDPEAWRQLRRARRAARLEHWEHVRALARDATERDPGFPMAWLELDLTYNKEDRARGPILDKVIDLGDRAPGLSPLSRQAVEWARQSRHGDEAAVRRAMEGLAALKLSGQDLLYVRTRLALAFFTQGEAEKGLPLFEWIAEKWPQDAAAPKKLADYYVGLDEPASLARAVRHGQRAVALAPDDVAARANLGRALLLTGDEAAARAQLAVIARADPDDKQGAFLSERTNRLFALHMALGEVDEAAADARRLAMDPGLRHAQGQAALAAIDLSRGAFDEGLAKLGATAEEYEHLDLDALAVDAHWQRAWQAYNLDRQAEAIAVAEHVGRAEPAIRDSLAAKCARRVAALGALARLGGGRAAVPGRVAAARQRIAELPPEGEWLRWRAHLELLVRYHARDWAGVVAAYRDLETGPVPLATTYYAADALERSGRPRDAALLFERLARHPSAWSQPYRRGQAWLRLGMQRERDGDRQGARIAFESLLRLWDRAPRSTAEIREAERRLNALADPS
jgi:tetratricopeptide (TPR) repeat protein